MEEKNEERKIYFIPDNFIEEGRVFQGRFRIRYLLEGLLLAAVFSSAALIIILCVPSMPMEGKICLIIFTGGPALAAGIAGYNGDPLSVVIRSAVVWSRHKTAMLYNLNPRLLKRDPLLSVMGEVRPLDGVLDSIETRRRENRERKANTPLEEGKDFRFAGDRYVDAYTRRRKKRPAKDRKNGQAEPPEYLIRKKTAPSAERVLSGDTELTDEGASDLLASPSAGPGTGLTGKDPAGNGGKPV